MLIEGTVLGAITLVGFGVMFKRLPQNVQGFCFRHPLFSEIIMVALFYSFMGFTLVAHVAAAVMSIAAMICFQIAREPEKYQFFYYLKDQANAKIAEIMKSLQEFSARKMDKIPVTETVTG